jgi:hypothetical protein
MREITSLRVVIWNSWNNGVGSQEAIITRIPTWGYEMDDGMIKDQENLPNGTIPRLYRKIIDDNGFISPKGIKKLGFKQNQAINPTMECFIRAGYPPYSST